MILSGWPEPSSTPVHTFEVGLASLTASESDLSYMPGTIGELPSTKACARCTILSHSLVYCVMSQLGGAATACLLQLQS